LKNLQMGVLRLGGKFWSGVSGGSWFHTAQKLKIGGEWEAGNGLVPGGQKRAPGTFSKTTETEGDSKWFNERAKG